MQTFDLADLAQFTSEGAYSTNASKDFHLFYVGRDDVHDMRVAAYIVAISKVAQSYASKGL